MLFNIKNEEYLVKFKYPEFYIEDFGHRVVTLCEFFSYNSKSKEKMSLFETYAICNPCDVFSKSFGRKLALQRALDLCVNFSKIERGQFWDQYFKQTNERRKNGHKRESKAPVELR